MRASRIVAGTLVVLASSPAVLWAQGGEAESGGAAMFNINYGLSAWTILVFLALVLVLTRYAWKPILSALEAREQGKHLWWRWLDRLGTYFDSKFGQNWKDGDKDIWDKFARFDV